MRILSSLTILGLIAIAVLTVAIHTGCPFMVKNAGASKTTQQVQEKSSTQADSEKAPTTYACPMHPDQTSTDPDAKCSICGMKMQPVSQDAQQTYACPMHPDQHSTNPNDKCAICGMKYEPVKKGDK